MQTTTVKQSTQPKSAKSAQGNARKLIQLTAALIVELDEAKAEIARLKGLEAPPRFIEQARRPS